MRGDGEEHKRWEEEQKSPWLKLKSMLALR